MPRPTNPNACLSCHRPEAPDRPGARFTGESEYGLELDAFFLCRECVVKGFSEDRCAACGKAETLDLPGNAFRLGGPNGRGPQPFFLHNECAPLAGPQQGVTQVYLDEIARRNK